MYTSKHQIEFKSTDDTTISTLPETGYVINKEYLVQDEGQQNVLYKMQIYKHDAGMVQGFPIGQFKDAATKGETYVSIIHPALSYLLRSVKLISELDLSTTLHVFPQKVIAVRKCRGFLPTREKCSGGINPENNMICRSCSGSGLDKTTATSAQDHVLVLMADNLVEQLDITKLVHYVNLPIDIVELLIKYTQDI